MSQHPNCFIFEVVSASCERNPFRWPTIVREAIKTICQATPQNAAQLIEKWDRLVKYCWVNSKARLSVLCYAFILGLDQSLMAQNLKTTANIWKDSKPAKRTWYAFRLDAQELEVDNSRYLYWVKKAHSDPA